MPKSKFLPLILCLVLVSMVRMQGRGPRSRQLVRMTDVENIAPHWIGSDKFVFESNRDGHWQLYTANAEGRDQVNISNNGFNDYQVSVSGDLTSFCFVSDRDGNPEVYVRQTDGQVRRLTNHPGDDLFPVFIGKSQIAFISARDTLNGRDVYLVDVDGTNLRKLVKTPEDESAIRISPNSKMIVALQSMKGKYAEDVVVIEIKTGKVTNLTNSLSTEGWPSWSHDGRYIYFASDRSAGTFNLFKVKADGSDLQQVTYISPPFMDTHPEVSPDGKKLLYNREVVGKNGRNTAAIYLMEAH